jgi:hypothetical protein
VPSPPGAFSPAREGGVERLHGTVTLIPALTGGAKGRLKRARGAHRLKPVPPSCPTQLHEM